MANKYDIFISYRRKDAGDKAEHLKDLLEPHYKRRISFDRENLTGKFNVQLIERIDSVKDFLLVIGKNSFCYTDADRSDESVAFYNELTNLSQEDFARHIDKLGPDANIDYVRIEIGRALRRKDIHIIPVVPERTESFNFASLNLPSDIAGVKTYEAVFYSDSPDALFKDVLPKVRKHMKSKADLMVNKTLIMSLLLALLLIGGVFAKLMYNQRQEDLIAKEAANIAKCKTDIENNRKNFLLYFADSLSKKQMMAVDQLLDNMVYVAGQELWISKFEFTKGLWHKILGEECIETEEDMPMTEVSYGDIYTFIGKLEDMTKLEFALPSAEEWEYAARGGEEHEDFTYVGSNEIDAVAWYKDNSGDQPHPSNGHTGKEPNGIDLFDMSGNVAEICNSPMVSGKGESMWTSCGGDYTSAATDVTVTSRKAISTDEKSKTLGFRLIIRKR